MPVNPTGSTTLTLEWDGAKAISNLKKHGVSFTEAAAVVNDANGADFDASAEKDGELRRKVVGLIDGRHFTVVYTWRGAALRMISARRSNPREIRRYDDG